MHPIRKRNRLADYDYSQSGAYFITVCTKDRKCILSRIVGGDAHIAPYTQLTKVGMVVEKYLKNIPGMNQYVVMPNHVHMIILIAEETSAIGTSVSSLVRSWKTLVSKEIGESIWQKSYYDHIIRDENDYIIRAQYIENNPAKWQEDDYFCI